MHHLGTIRPKRWPWVVSMAVLVLFAWTDLHAQGLTHAAASDSPAPRKWAATAPGRVEPASGEIRISALMAGRIVRVLVAPNEKVFPGELLIRLDDEEALARLAEVQAQVVMRLRARDDETKKGASDRRRAGDAVADGARSVADAQARLDQSVEAARNAGRSPIEDGAVTAARAGLSSAQGELRKRRDALSAIEQTVGLPNFPESELEIARANLRLARTALEKTRIRAPVESNVLQVDARAGEVAAPVQQQPLLVLGDISSLRVRAELDERDSTKVKVGQTVSVRANAFKDRTFAGKVARVAQFVGPSRSNAPPARGKLNDIDVVEVMIDLTDPGPIAVGMQVDVYFQPDGVDVSSK